MNPGAVEEGAKVAGGFIEAMKSQPLALALALCNLTLLALFFYIAHWSGSNRAMEFKALLESNKEVQKLLYNCTPLANLKGQRYVPQSEESHPVELPPLPQPRPKEAQ